MDKKIEVNAMGDACPIPVVKTKRAVGELAGPGQVDVWVDNEIAVQNLEKMAKQKGYEFSFTKSPDGNYKVCLVVKTDDSGQEDASGSQCVPKQAEADNRRQDAEPEQEDEVQKGHRIEIPARGAAHDGIRESGKWIQVVAVGSDCMGSGEAELGRALLKGFLYALTEQEKLPDTMLFYNRGAGMTCEGSDSLEDLKALEGDGVRILTCGTCLNYYGLSEALRVGNVTNMYEIAEIMLQADRILKP